MADLTAEMAYTAQILHNDFVTRAAVGGDAASRPPAYRAVGLSLAVASGVFIGISFVLKKVGLLKANAKYNEQAGEGYGYLKNFHWWGGMTLMIIGEICNFVAYAFVDAILVTPLGALSVVVTTILSAIFLKERLSFVGKVGCFSCIIGSIIIVVNAPEQSAVADIQEMQHFVIAPGFLSYAGVIIVGCAFVAFWVGPRYGKKSMLVYLSICSLIGGLSVVATQGLGSAVVAQAGGKPQFNQWFLYVLLVFVVGTLLTEIIYLNKALNLFNAALVTPTYYVFFTSSTIVSSAILFRGFHGTGVQIATVIMGFLVICSGVILLQMSKSAKDVPDAAVFKGDLDQVREIGEQEQPETEPKADAIRGTSAILRRISTSRRRMEEKEADRLRRETDADHLEPLRENEVVEWDGLRRRKTIVGPPGSGAPQRRQSTHPPLGMSRFPEPEEQAETQDGHSFFYTVRSRALSVLHREQQGSHGDVEEAKTPVPMTTITANKPDTPIAPYGPGSLAEAEEHIYGLPKGLRRQQDKEAGIPAAQSPHLPQDSNTLRPKQEARRQFSFNNFWNRRSVTPSESDVTIAPGRPRIASRASSNEKRALKSATEEERLGLVKGDSSSSLLQYASPERITPGAATANTPMIAVHSPNESVSSNSDEDYFYGSPTRAPRSAQPHYPFETRSDELSQTIPRVVPAAVTRSSPTSSPPSRPPTHSYHQQSQQGTQARTARRASPPLPPLPTSVSTINATPQLSNQVNHSSQYRRPLPPKHYHPAAVASNNNSHAPISDNSPVAKHGQRHDRTPGQAMPAAMSSGPSQTLSTRNHPYHPSQPSHDYQSHSSTRQDLRQVARVVGKWEIEREDGLAKEGSGEEGDSEDTPKKRFEEQSKREREQRRKRVSRPE